MHRTPSRRSDFCPRVLHMRAFATGARHRPQRKNCIESLFVSYPLLLAGCVCGSLSCFRLSPLRAHESRTFGREGTHSEGKLWGYFDSAEGVSANSRFIARGESPTER